MLLEGTSNKFLIFSVFKAYFFNISWQYFLMFNYKNYSEQELIRLVKESDAKAFEELYYKYVTRLSSFINFYFGKSISYEETIQDAFLKIWEKRALLDESKSFNAYLIEIAKNLVYNNFKHKLQEEKYKQTNNAWATGVNDIEEYINHKELREQIEKGMEVLPPIQKEIFIMSRQEGLSHDEIAQRLNISKRTVEHQIYRTLKILKQILPKKLHMVILLYIFQ
jgi:RNA polymerase sigma-70 factor (family 1)